MDRDSIDRKARVNKKHDYGELELWVYGTVGVLLIGGFLCDSPRNILNGLWQILYSRDALITDYFVLGGYGAGLVNAGLVMGICTILVKLERIPFTGPTLAALYICAGYGLWGKNPVNILPVFLGVWLYARTHKAGLGRYIYTALFGTCLAPFVTEMMYLLPGVYPVRLLMAVGMGVLIGFILPSLSAHTASMHMGYNLFNVGFSAGVAAFVIVCMLRALGMDSEPVFLWREGCPGWLLAAQTCYFLAAFGLGLWMCRGKLDGLRHLLRHPGRAVADFVLMDGAGAALMNMALVGLIGMTYIVLCGGDLSGPVLGAVWMAFGFAAFGAHVKNYVPVLLGVYLFTWVSRYTPSTPGIQLAALFAVGLAPVAGQFGIAAGLLAGALHSSIVMCTSSMYGGLNLYNNGFSAGCTAIFLVPVLESFMKHFEDYRTRRRQRKYGEKEDA